MKLPHVVWDMGGILYRYFTEVMRDRGAERGWPIDRIPLGPTGDVRDADYERMQDGEIDEADYLALVVARLRAAGIDDDPRGTIDWADQERRETWAAIRTIHRAGHRQAVLTNDASRWLGPNWWETWKPAGWFEAMVDVTTIGERKPAPRPYLAAAEALDADPTECVFVDDMRVNCRGAEAVGMASFWFDVRAPGESVDKLLATLGLSASER
ncbi:MAG TPA: HAD-IA family hydrolase [Actinomycetota bacterium]|nr:HAD-IA family hydrolase [Actinomycetota bacterium]